LTPDAVRAEGIEAQPLVLPGVTLADGQTHDII
jgi:hypothetical protein